MTNIEDDEDIKVVHNYEDAVRSFVKCLEQLGGTAGNIKLKTMIENYTNKYNIAVRQAARRKGLAHWTGTRWKLGRRDFE